MEKENTIDEMALIIGGSEIFEHEDYLEAKQKAKELYIKGYRKADEVITEFKTIVMDYLQDRGLYLTAVKNALIWAEKVVLKGE